MTYRERREARAEQLRGWAEKREAKSNAMLDHAHAMADVIPFGQPILVGHHSERRDRNYRDRVWNAMGAAVENARKADAMQTRAANIEAQAAHAIYTDDADAVERLEQRIAELEAERDAIKAENAAFRKTHRAELATMTAYQRNEAMPHPAYRVTNLTGNIKRNRDRLQQVRQQQERQAAAEAAEGGVLVEQLGHGYCRVTFTEKPARDVLTALKAAGYRWGQGAWTGQADRLPEEVQV